MFSINNWRDGKKWINWSGNQSAHPNRFYAPCSIEEVCQIVKEHVVQKKTLRVTGAGHSFSPVAVPEDSALTLHHLRGLCEVNHENQTATFYAGTYLYEIGPILEKHGYALINMGDINAQTLAGAISTGTHGTGVTLGSFSSIVQKWGFVNGEGEYIEHERGEDDLSEALHLSMGLMGILVTVTIHVMPLYSLTYISERLSLHKELMTFQQTIREHRHLEWYYFPGSETIQVKKMDQVALQRRSPMKRRMNRANIQLMENGVFYLASQLCKWKPSLSLTMSKISSKVITAEEKTDIAYEIFPTPRNVKFVETEYAIPLNRFEECLEEIHTMFLRKDFHVHFPIECRTSKGEMGFLSPTQGKESAFIAFHMFKGMDETDYFHWVHELMKSYNGRPHWGKVNQYDKTNIEHFYPNAAKFNAVRKLHDPHGVFLTKYFQNIFSEL